MASKEPAVAPEKAWQSQVRARLFEARTIVLSGEIDTDLTRGIVEQLLAMSTVSADPITFYVNSPGGHVESADSIHDLVSFLAPRVRMIGTGWVASAAAHLFLGVPKEDRYCLPNTRFLLHQPMGGSGGRATDLEIEAKQILDMRARLNRIIAEKTGQSIKRVEKDTERNFWMTAEEAKDYGLVGKIITSVSALKGGK